MKKLLTLTIALFTLLITTSCKKELPSNIKSTLAMQNMYCDELNKGDSLIVKLNDNDITNMSKDDAKDLIYKHNSSYSSYMNYSNELDEMFKLNPEYSDYDEIKNQTRHLLPKNFFELSEEKRVEITKNGVRKLDKNIQKLENKINDMPISYDGRPVDFKF